MPPRAPSPHRSDAPQGAPPAVDQAPPPSPELVHARIRAAAVVPHVLLLPCRVHAAAVGQHCYRNLPGVCGRRVDLAWYGSLPWHKPSGRVFSRGRYDPPSALDTPQEAGR